jgi:hypothetical protein
MVLFPSHGLKQLQAMPLNFQSGWPSKLFEKKLEQKFRSSLFQRLAKHKGTKPQRHEEIDSRHET